MRRPPEIGLLPLYLKLYDDTMPDVSREFEPFIAEVTRGFEERGVSVVLCPVCRVAEEFNSAVGGLEEKGVDLIAALHLAYSPSLESIDALASTRLPILMLDTTMDHEFGQDVAADRIMFNHGIHGVQDLACMLRRRGKPFRIVAGHVTQSDAMARAADIARAARAARLLKNTRALRIGESFKGMGDFAPPEDVMRDALGIVVDEIAVGELAADVESIQPDVVEYEMNLDRERFECEVSEEVHRRSVRVGLGLRKRIDTCGYTAFSMNFLSFDKAVPPIDTVPFLEASKAMSRGIGYAGEGDVLTASLVGALSQVFEKTTFAEVFCPDWRGGTLFLSHMGEINPDVASAKPVLFEKDFPFTPALNPAVAACAIEPGPAALVNLAPGPDDSFGLIVARVDVLADETGPGMRHVVRAWVRPSRPLESFLEEYSRHGGTHHSALVMGDRVEAIAAFASFAGIPITII